MFYRIIFLSLSAWLSFWVLRLPSFKMASLPLLDLVVRHLENWVINHWINILLISYFYQWSMATFPIHWLHSTYQPICQRYRQASDGITQRNYWKLELDFRILQSNAIEGCQLSYVNIKHTCCVDCHKNNTLHELSLYSQPFSRQIL